MAWRGNALGARGVEGEPGWGRGLGVALKWAGGVTRGGVGAWPGSPAAAARAGFSAALSLEAAPPAASPEAAHGSRGFCESPACSELRGTWTGPVSQGRLGSSGFGGSAEWEPHEVRLHSCVRLCGARAGRGGRRLGLLAGRPRRGISPRRRLS